MVPLKSTECAERYSRCQVENCCKDPRFTIHNIPQSNKIQRQRIRQQWIKVLNIELKAKSFYVCGNHFAPEDFTNKSKCRFKFMNLQRLFSLKLLIGGGRLRLKSCAVPSRNIPRLNTLKERIVYNHQNELSEKKFYKALQGLLSIV